MPESLSGCCGQRDLFVTGPGPDAGGSNQGKDGCIQTPVNSGIDAAPAATRAVDAAPPVDATPAAEAAPAADRTARERFLLPDGKLFWRVADCWADAAVANPRKTKLDARRMALREMRLLLGSVGRVISRVFRANGIIGTQTRLRILKLPAVEACGESVHGVLASAGSLGKRRAS